MSEEFDVEAERQQIAIVSLVSMGAEIVAGPSTSGVCCGCGRLRDDIARRRLNTRYENDASNWLESCAECWRETVDHYNELWATR